MNIVRYKSVLDDFAPSAFGQLIDRFFNDSISRFGGTAYAFVPKVDIIEGDKAFEIQLTAPGMDKKDFKIDVVDNQLTIEGERKWDEKHNFRYRETRYGAFRRTFGLPDEVDDKGIEARYDKGILHVVVPKKEKKLKRTTVSVA